MLSSAWVRPKKHKCCPLRCPPIDPHAHVLGEIDFVQSLATKLHPPKSPSPPLAPAPHPALVTKPTETEQKMLAELIQIRTMLSRKEEEEKLARVRDEGVRQGEQMARTAGALGGGGGGMIGTGARVVISGGLGGGGGSGGGLMWYAARQSMYAVSSGMEMKSYDALPVVYPYIQHRRITCADDLREMDRNFGEYVGQFERTVSRDIEQIGDRITGMENALAEQEKRHKRDRIRERKAWERQIEMEHAFETVLGNARVRS